jgi:hypothetical protein
VSEELQAQLTQLLGMMQSGVEAATEQFPPLVGEIILYGRVRYSLAIIVVYGLVLYCISVLRSDYHQWLILDGDAPGAKVFASIVGLFALAIATVGMLPWFLMTWFAPRLYVVDWLRRLVN